LREEIGMAFNSSSLPQKQERPRSLRAVLVKAAVSCGIAIAVLLAPFAAVFLPIFAFLVAYLWVYTGLPAACAGFVVAWLAARKQRLQRSALVAVIVYASVGIALMASMTCFRWDPFLIGYGLHTRTWLDADDVRRWAGDLDLVGDDYGGVEVSGPPLTLRIAGLPAGRVWVYPETRDVTVEQGGALSGHWGVWITARGRQWEAAPAHLEDARSRKVEDGVWVYQTRD
jgi:hypothetical protein